MRLQKTFTILRRWMAVLLVASSSYSAGAAEGQLRIISAVASEGVLKFTLGGKVFNDQGYQEGEGSGWIGLKTGTHTLKGSHPDHGSLSIPVSLKPGDRKAVIVFLKSKPPSKVGLPPQRILRYMTLDCSGGSSSQNKAEKKPATTATLLLLEAPEPVKFNLGKKEVTLIAGQSQKVEIARMGLHVSLETSDALSLATFSLEEPGDHFAVIFKGVDGTLKAVAFKD